MPVYEYLCQDKKCNNAWEEEQKITDSVILECPKCKLNTAKRLISGGQSFQLLGSCWAKDNYSKK